ncbi:MAG: metal ABC transporter substrate-binding protein [Myxacorys californica WJT36-NPBG1]|jgi:manganese transport system substrate-binding protein|nr:metal ABC transporter substrate-binding protein [Myxacorys californica WJT36-NPBG1]
MERKFSHTQQSAVTQGSCTVLLGLLLGLWLGGCTSQTAPPQQNAAANSQSPRSPAQQQKKVILTTFTVLADMVRNVAGDRAIVESLTKPGAEIHDYEPTPSDLAKAQDVDLILDNGLGLERWAERFYGNVKDVPHVTLTAGIQLISIAEGAYQSQPNPHAWMSPQNALIYVENIRKALVELDPKNAATYNANASAYSDQIKAIDQTLRKNLAVLPENNRYMVTCEGAFSYLTRDYGMKELYLWAVNSDQEGTPKQVSQVVDAVKANQIPVVFCESTVNNGAQKQVASETNAKFGGIFYVDSLSDMNGDAPTYLKLLEYNVTTLINGLQGKS